MLPAVLAWNAKQQTSRQETINDALGGHQRTAAESVKLLISDLGLPTSLRQVDIERDQLSAIAQKAAQHPVVRKNPRQIKDAEDVMEILELAW